MRLQQKVIIITGSCTGIGQAMAERCVQEGAQVVIHGLPQEEEQGKSVVASLGSDNAVLLTEDITNEGAPARLAEVALTTFGQLNAIINNAAWVAPSNVHTTDPTFFRRILEVNTIGPFLLIQAALPALRRSGGCVLNIGSVNAWGGEADLLAYSVSKGALMTLTRNLGDALHISEGVRVNQINPGWVLTENEDQRKQAQGLGHHWYQRIARTNAPAGRIFKPAEIAAAAVYWVSDEAGPVSGQVVDLEQYPFIGRNPSKNE